MGGAFDGGVDLDVKSSPHEVAIEKTKEELRQEYDVREEKRRELEFLEKGGNPLNFQFVRSVSLSIQSTSLTGQHHEHVVKESFPLSTSSHGDSSESSGHPGTSLAHEPNFADNLLLFDCENSGTRNNTITDKRKSTAAFGRSSKLDGSYTITRETEDSILLHLGVKSQAYARRNKSKSSRESSHLGATGLAQTSNGNREVLLSLQPDISDAKVQVCETQMDFTVSNSKATSSSKNFAAVDQLHMDLDLVEPNKECLDLKEIPEFQKNNISTSEKIHGNDRNELVSCDTSEQEPSGIISASSSLVGNGEESILNVTAQPSSDTLNHPEIIKKSSINCFSKSGVNTSSLSNEDKDTKKCTTCAETDISSSNGLEEPVVNDKDNDYMVNDNTSGNHIFVGDSNGASIKEAAAKQSTFVHGSIGNRDNGDLRLDNHDNDHKLWCLTYANAIVSHSELMSKDGFDNITMLHDKTRSPCNMDSRKIDGENLSQSEAKLASFSLLSGSHEEAAHTHLVAPCNLVSPNCEISDASLSQKRSLATSHVQDDLTNSSKLAKAHEDCTLREARIIQAKLKRAGELPWGTSARRQCSHWDYVLEEMAWLANDFMQERIWKITAASQISRRIAVMGKAKLEGNNLGRKQREVAKILAKVVMKFWDSAEDNKDMLENKNEQPLQQLIKCYAARFLQSQSSHTEVFAAEAPRTPDRVLDAVSLEMSREEQNSDESFFYNVPVGAMYSYRESVETYWLQYEKMGRATNRMDCEAAAGDSTSEFNVHESMEDDEAETGTHYMHGAFEGKRPLDYAHKKRNFLQQKNCNSRSYEPGLHFLHFQHVPGIENKVGTQQPSFVMGKRASGAHSIGPIPTKCVRTASRQRVISPFSINDSRANQMTSKTDASSGDTSSFQDDQCSLQGSLHPRKKSYFESTVDFEKPTPFDGNGIPLKHKKKKKPKHLGFKSSLNVIDSGRFVASGKLQGSSYEQRWTSDSIALEQRDYSNKRSEGHHFESSGTGCIDMQQMPKKAKILKQSTENSSEALVPLGGHVSFPIASQMSNMSNSNKLIKVLPNRDRGKKTKGLKAAVGIQSGSGSPWSLLDDQTLVALVHDMGPNWELISDAINSAVQFKCVFRKPKECKERHKILMDKSTGDGADSADDSGSSQPYPSTLPDIPKASARQLLQCLQGPMEEDTLKVHFEKIILIGQKLHSCRVQDNLNLKQISPDHNSHLVALSQVCPNNLTGGLLTPFDLCDVTTTHPEVLGYQGAPTNGIALRSYQGPVPPIIPSTGGGAMLQGSPGLVMGTSFSAPSTVANASSRDAQGYGVPRSTALCADDQQRMQQYGQMVPGRIVQGPSSIGAECGVRILPDGNGTGMLGGMSRGMPLPRPGFQGLGSPGGLNIVSSGSMLLSTGIGIPSPVNIHPGSMHGQGNSILRPHDSLPRTFPQQHQQSHQMPQPPQVHGNVHHPQTQGSSHTNPQQRAYNTHVAKERQLHQRLVHQQKPFAGPNGIMPLQNGSQLPQSTVSSSPMTPLSSSQPQQKQQNMSHNSQANANLLNQLTKQRQRQQMHLQSPRQQTQQQQPAQSQTKPVKGSGREGSTMLQNSPIEASVANGSSAIGNQALDKHIIQQNQVKFSGGSGSNLTLPQKPNQQKMYPRLESHTSKQMPTDSCGQGQNQIPSSQALLASQQSHASPSLPLTSQNQQQRQTNQFHQPMQRVMFHQNHLKSDGRVRNADVSIQANQMMATPNTQCSDSVSKVRDVSSVPISTSKWKHGPSYEANTQTPNARTLKQSNLVRVDSSIPVSSQGLAERQFPGSFPVHGNGTGGAWQQQQQLPLHLQYPQHQQLHRPIEPNLVYGQPSSSRPG